MTFALLTRLRPSLPTSKLAVDSLCIPLHPPYSLSLLLPPPTPLPRPTLLKLHQLAALLPPSTPAAWASLDDLGALVAIMDGVRAFPAAARTGIVDSRVRADEDRIAASGHERVERVVDGAREREGPYFVVRTPEGIRGAKVRQGGE